MRRITILLADDHAVVIEGLRRILACPQFEIVGAVSDGRALLQAAAELQPDVIIADIAMPSLNGIEAARQIRTRNLKSKIVFLTMHSEPIYAVEALDTGASGYVLKSSAGAELVAAVQEVIKGHVFVARSIAESVKRARESRPVNYRSAIGQLTQRQREVLQLVAEGRQAKEIAMVLNVSPKTVEFHKYRIMDLLGIRTAAELALFAAKHGIVE